MSVTPHETDYSEPPPPQAPLEDKVARAPAAGAWARGGRRGARLLDVAIGVLAGVLAIVFVPGIALAGIGAVVVLLLVGLSLLYRRARFRHATRAHRRRR